MKAFRKGTFSYKGNFLVSFEATSLWQFMSYLLPTLDSDSRPQLTSEKRWFPCLSFPIFKMEREILSWLYKLLGDSLLKTLSHLCFVFEPCHLSEPFKANPVTSPFSIHQSFIYVSYVRPTPLWVSAVPPITHKP